MVKVRLSKKLIEKQALLLQEISAYEDINTGGINKIILHDCCDLISQTYGFDDWNHLRDEINKSKEDSNIEIIEK